MSNKKRENFSPFREKIYEIIFKADTPGGKAFDVALLITIVASVIAVMVESISGHSDRVIDILHILEWIFTIFFTIEYILRLYSVYSPKKYATSFFGIIDLLAILPTYLSVLVSGTQTLIVIRALRLLRVFRIFKLAKFLKESHVIMIAFRQSQPKITVFLVFILTMVTIIGSIMYLVEVGQDSGFTSIPDSIYWAIVTITTVGYGDIHPVTPVGRFLAAIVMIMGYSVIAVPTGIISAEIISHSKEQGKIKNLLQCTDCGMEGHEEDASYCKYCGEKLSEEPGS